MYNKIIYYLKRFDYKRLIVPSIFMIIYICSFVFMYYTLGKKINVKNNETIDNSILSLNEEVEESNEYIYVDIKGEIVNPGVYKLENGSRVNDLINISGGLTEDANTRFINLSKELKDGDAIIIYSNKEIEEAKETKTIVVETPCVCEEITNDACIIENLNENNNTSEENNDTNNKTNDNSNNNSNNNSKININTASLEELKTLSGIGDAKAKSIIEYRTQNGNFASIEDITKVSGISESIFSKIKENITI